MKQFTLFKKKVAKEEVKKTEVVEKAEVSHIDTSTLSGRLQIYNLICDSLSTGKDVPEKIDLGIKGVSVSKPKISAKGRRHVNVTVYDGKKPLKVHITKETLHGDNPIRKLAEVSEVYWLHMGKKAGLLIDKKLYMYNPDNKTFKVVNI